MFGSVVHQLPRLKGLGYSDDVLQHLARARVASSNATYESKWKLFESFCAQRQVDPFVATPPLVADFLLHVATTRRAAVSTLAGYRSAIGNVLRLSIGYDVGTCPILAQLMRSFKRTQPVPATRVPVWDISLVLESLCDVRFATESLDLHLLTAKAVFLVALASGDRCHALAALKWPPVFDESGAVLEFLDGFVPKSFFLKRNISRVAPLCLPQLPAESLWQVCPVRVLRHYVERVTPQRDPAQKTLFIPHSVNKRGNLKPQAVGRYITFLVAKCYKSRETEVGKVRAHDVRKIATSLRDLTSTALSDVLEAGRWTTPHMFLRHYKTSFSESQRAALQKFTGVVAAKSVISFQ